MTTDDAVHGEEGRVEPALVARRDERVLVGEQPGDRRDTEPVEEARVEREAGGREERDRGDVARARENGKGRGDAEARRHRVQTLGTVDVEVEERVEHVEPGHPDRDGGAEEPGLQGSRS